MLMLPLYKYHPGWTSFLNRTERGAFVLEALRAAIPRPETELTFRNEYELIVAVILSAQCTDERVNQVSDMAYVLLAPLANLT